MGGTSINDVLEQSQTSLQTAYQAQDLARLLESLRQQQVNGTLQLEVEIPLEGKWERVLTWYKGEITYGGTEPIERGELIRKLVQKFRPEYAQSVENWLTQQLVHPFSSRDLLNVLVNRQVLTWEQIEGWAQY